MGFNEWFIVFLKEKGMDMSRPMSDRVQLGDFCSFILSKCGDNEKAGIKKMIVSLDFQNADIFDYLMHLFTHINEDNVVEFKKELDASF